MKSQRRRSGDIVIDRARQPDDLHPEIFIDGPGAAEASVSAQYDQCAVVKIGLKMFDRGRLNAFVLEILKPAAANGAAGLAHHPPRVSLADLLNPIVGKAEKSVTNEMNRNPELRAGDVELLQGGAGAGEVSARYQRNDPP